MSQVLALLALAIVSFSEVQVALHVGDHFAHTHEHREGSAKRRGTRVEVV